MGDDQLPERDLRGALSFGGRPPWALMTWLRRTISTSDSEASTSTIQGFILDHNTIVSGAIGLAIFVSFPVAPPRLLPTGFVDTVTELSNSYRILQPPSLINKFAAVPSLHVGWNLLIGVTEIADQARTITV